MVSFSCEACGDVLTKKKLDSHRNQCRSASFTCIDCMTHFPATSYRAHTSCISEDQKYQGKLYKDKKSKAQLPNDAQALIQREVFADITQPGAVAAVSNVPPKAPSPPRTVVNVFDYLIGDTTSNVSKISVDECRMIEDAQEPTKHMPGAFGDARATRPESNGYMHTLERVGLLSDHYQSSAASPTKKSPLTPEIKYKCSKDKNQSTGRKSDKKRKRQALDEADSSGGKLSPKQDATMMDAPSVSHTGLTRVLDRMLAPAQCLSSPNELGRVEASSPLSPTKRKRHSKAEPERGRNREAGPRKSLTLAEQDDKSKREQDPGKERKRPRELVKIRRRQASSPSPRQDQRPTKTSKAIEYHPDDQTNGASTALVTHSQSRVELFLSYITKGPESERGLSLNKALKRYHRDRIEQCGNGVSKQDDEKELWKSIRLRRNDKGEIVLFTGP